MISPILGVFRNPVPSLVPRAVVQHQLGAYPPDHGTLLNQNEMQESKERQIYWIMKVQGSSRNKIMVQPATLTMDDLGRVILDM